MKRLLPVAALSLVVLSGCAHNPQVAATVAGHDISTHDVDVLTKALCVEQSQSSQGGPTTLASLRASALSALISSDVDADYAKENDLKYSPTTLSAQVGQLDSLITKLPAKDQDLARSLISDLLRGQIQLQQAVVQQIRQAGQQPTQQSVTQGMQLLEQQHATKLKTTVNPRYDIGTATESDNGSVSRAVSADAKDALTVLRGGTSTSYVSSLPSSQRCG
ncbi:MAG TPA: hypothetical protein VF426_11350 [Marmoricola sp.]